MVIEYARSDIIRLDSREEQGETYYSKEGFLYDDPIVTRTGIFTYHNPDGSVRKEFRPAEEVFSPESLASFRGKPVILTHDAGYIDKDNVADEEIGTIMDAYRDGNYVRCHIVIHDTDAMKDSRLRELSVGYNLDLDETPGEYKGEHFDVVQRNIRVNHLALVKDARAGDSARLNIDSKDTETIVLNNEQGGSSMRRHDSESVDPKDLETKIDGFVAENGGVGNVEPGQPAATDAKDNDPATEAQEEQPVEQVEKVTEATVTPVAETAKPEAPENTDAAEDPTAEQKEPEKTPAETIKAIREKYEANKDAEDPEDLESAKKLIAGFKKDCSTLFDCIDKLDAANDMQAAGAEEANDNPAAEEPKTPAEEANAATKADSEEEETMNTDSVDARVRERVKVLRVGDKLHMDGLEDLSLLEAKKAIIRKVNPKMNFDGKSKMYINSAYDFVLDNVVGMQKDSNYQRAQMRGFGMNLDEKDAPNHVRSASDARADMIKRMDNEGGND